MAGKKERKWLELLDYCLFYYYRAGTQSKNLLRYMSLVLNWIYKIKDIQSYRVKLYFRLDIRNIYLRHRFGLENSICLFLRLEIWVILGGFIALNIFGY